jgi:hypothetical protein
MTPRPRPPVATTEHRCVYCGGPTSGKLTCRAHQPLLALDPRYTRDLQIPTTRRWWKSA